MNTFPKPTTPEEYASAYKQLSGQIYSLMEARNNMAIWYAEKNGAYPKGTILTLKNGEKCKVLIVGVFEYVGTVSHYCCYTQDENGEFGNNYNNYKEVFPYDVASAELPKGEEE